MKYHITISKEEILNPSHDDSGYDIAAGVLALCDAKPKKRKAADMTKLEEFRTEARKNWAFLNARADTNRTQDVDDFVDAIIENIPPEKAEPKPRWQDKTNGDTYTVRGKNGRWEIWISPECNGEDYLTRRPLMSGVFPSKQEAIDALDKWCGERMAWERCDEAKEESDEEVLAEIKELREKLGLGPIFGFGNGGWGIMKGPRPVDNEVPPFCTFPQLLDRLREMNKPEPVTNEEVRGAWTYLKTTPDGPLAGTYHEIMDRLIKELS